MRIINLHLGSSWSKRTAQLEAIRAQVPAADYYLVLGDWNMIESPADGPEGYSGLKWSKPFAAAYRSFMDHFRLTERAQPRMTHFAITTPDGKPPSLIATRIAGHGCPSTLSITKTSRAVRTRLAAA